MTEEKRKKQEKNPQIGLSVGHQVSTLTPTSKEESVKMSHLTFKNGRVWPKIPRNSFSL